MTEAQLKQSGYDTLYLSVCAVKGIVPKKEVTDNIDMEQLLKFCKFHSLSGIVAFALESAGIIHKGFQSEKNNAIRKIMLLDAERKQITDFLEKNNIWYMPLKGVFLKDYYPRLGMRQMCDNDILVDNSAMNAIEKFMTARGYKLTSFEETVDREFTKKPVYNFEMHRCLFPSYPEKKWYSYYKNIHKKLVRVKGCEYRFTDEDFYIYMVTHEYKHYKSGGTGLRSLVDSYVFLERFGDKLDWDYVRAECRKLGVSEYEEKNRLLSEKLFAAPQLPELSEDERNMLDYHILSGTYGTLDNGVKNKLREFSVKTESPSKFKYIMHRIFPPLESYKSNFPFFYRYKILLPAGWLYRIIRGLTRKRSVIRREFDIIRKLDIKNDKGKQ